MSNYFYIEIKCKSPEELTARIQDNKLRGFDVYRIDKPIPREHAVMTTTNDYGRKNRLRLEGSGTVLCKAIMRRPNRVM